MQHSEMLLLADFTGLLQSACFRCMIPATAPTAFVFNLLCDLGCRQCLEFGAQTKVMLTGVAVRTVRLYLGLSIGGICTVTWSWKRHCMGLGICTVVHSGGMSLHSLAFFDLLASGPGTCQLLCWRCASLVISPAAMWRSLAACTFCQFQFSVCHDFGYTLQTHRDSWLVVCSVAIFSL